MILNSEEKDLLFYKPEKPREVNMIGKDLNLETGKQVVGVQSGFTKSNDTLEKHSEIINSLSRNSDRIIKSKSKAIWRLSFEVRIWEMHPCILFVTTSEIQKLDCY